MSYSSNGYPYSSANHEGSPAAGYTLMLSSKVPTKPWKGVSILYFNDRQDAHASVTVLCKRIRILYPQCVFAESLLLGDHTWTWVKKVWEEKGSDRDKGDETARQEKKCRGITCREKECKGRTCKGRLCKDMVCEDRTCIDKACKAIHDKREFWGILWLEPTRRTTYSTSSSCFDQVVRATLQQMQDNGDIEEAARAAETRRNKFMLSMEKMKMSRKGAWESLGPLEVDSEEGLQELGNHIADMKADGLWEFEGERSDASEGYDLNDEEEEEHESE